MSHAVSLGVGLRAALAALAIVSCSSTTVVQKNPGDTGETDEPYPQNPDATVVFARATTRIALEVSYQSGAAPYTDAVPGARNAWEIFNTNARAIWDGRKDVIYPRSLGEMEEITDITATEFTEKDVLAIARKHRKLASGDGAVAYYAVFLNGALKNDSGVVSNAVSVAIKGTGVLAIFKPPIARYDNAEKPVPSRLMEQAALLHAFGHAVGFVANGLEVASPHHDEANGAHCSNDQCIMHWTNEGADRLIQYAASKISSSNSLVYGQGCLSDVRIFEQKSGQ
jgi:hypothetical protein